MSLIPNITIVLDSLELGGAERQALLLARELIERGGEVQFIGLTTGGKAGQMMKADGIPHTNLGLTYSYGKLDLLKNFKKVRKALKATEPEIIIPYTYWPNVLCGNVWQRTGADKCFWNQRDEGLHMFGTFFEKRALNKATHIVANSPSGKKALQDRFQLEHKTIHVIPNGIRLAERKAHWKDWREFLGLDEDKLSAVMVANLHEKKDHPTLLKAWAEVVNQMPMERPVLMLAGRLSGTQEKLKAQAEELGIADEVKLLGPADDITSLLDSNDIMVHSSATEGCPNAVLEGMLASLTVVATDIPGIQMAVGEDYKWLVPVGDHISMSKKIIMALNNTGARQETGKQNKKRVQMEFSPRKMVDRYIELFNT